MYASISNRDAERVRGERFADICGSAKCLPQKGIIEMMKRALIICAIAVAGMLVTESVAKADHCISGRYGYGGFGGGHVGIPVYTSRVYSSYRPYYAPSPVRSYRYGYPSYRYGYGAGRPSVGIGYGVGYGYGYGGGFYPGYRRSGISIGIGF